MRAVIQFTSESVTLTSEAVKNILILEGWTVIDFYDDEFWNKPENLYQKLHKEDFVNAIQPAEAKDLKFLYYIHRGLRIDSKDVKIDNVREGIVSRNVETKYYGIRIFKKKKKMLREACERTIEHIIDTMDNPKSPVKFNPVRVYAKDGEGELIEVGVVHKNKADKRRLAIRQKSIEFYAGLFFISMAVIISILSFVYRNPDNSFIENARIFNLFWLNYSERLISPLLISGGLLFYQYYNHHLKMVRAYSTVEWFDE
jgi:hypothetical protein